MHESSFAFDARPSLDANALLRLFYESPEVVCHARCVPPGSVPPPFDRLLVHENHMTVTVESFHQSLVDVKVLEERRSDEIYARRILLTRQSDGQVVQFGVVRLHRNLIPSTARERIESGEIPLGRVLIEQGVMRKVQLLELWQCAIADALQLEMGLDEPSTLFGRTAVIHVDEKPVVELLEIVTDRPPAHRGEAPDHAVS